MCYAQVTRFISNVHRPIVMFIVRFIDVVQACAVGVLCVLEVSNVFGCKSKDEFIFSFAYYKCSAKNSMSTAVDRLRTPVHAETGDENVKGMHVGEDMLRPQVPMHV